MHDYQQPSHGKLVDRSMLTFQPTRMFSSGSTHLMI